MDFGSKLLVSEVVGDTGLWNLLTFLRKEFPNYADFVVKVNIDLDSFNKLVWMPSSTGDISCKANYFSLHKGSGSSGSGSKDLWNAFIPHARAFFFGIFYLGMFLLMRFSFNKGFLLLLSITFVIKVVKLFLIFLWIACMRKPFGNLFPYNLVAWLTARVHFPICSIQL